MGYLASIKIAKLAVLGGEKSVLELIQPRKKTLKKLTHKQRLECIKYVSKHLQLEEISISPVNSYIDSNFQSSLTLEYNSHKFHSINKQAYLTALYAEGVDITNLVSNAFSVPFFSNWIDDKHIIDQYITAFQKVHDRYQELL